MEINPKGDKELTLRKKERLSTKNRVAYGLSWGRAKFKTLILTVVSLILLDRLKMSTLTAFIDIEHLVSQST